MESLENPESMMIYYVVLRGVEKFQTEYNSYPGELDDHVEPDIIKLKVSSIRSKPSQSICVLDHIN